MPNYLADCHLEVEAQGKDGFLQFSRHSAQASPVGSCGLHRSIAWANQIAAEALHGVEKRQGAALASLMRLFLSMPEVPKLWLK